MLLLPVSFFFCGVLLSVCSEGWDWRYKHRLYWFLLWLLLCNNKNNNNRTFWKLLNFTWRTEKTPDWCRGVTEVWQSLPERVQTPPAAPLLCHWVSSAWRSSSSPPVRSWTSSSLPAASSGGRTKSQETFVTIKSTWDWRSCRVRSQAGQKHNLLIITTKCDTHSGPSLLGAPRSPALRVLCWWHHQYTWDTDRLESGHFFTPDDCRWAPKNSSWYNISMKLYIYGMYEETAVSPSRAHCTHTVCVLLIRTVMILHEQLLNDLSSDCVWIRTSIRVQHREEQLKTDTFIKNTDVWFI